MATESPVRFVDGGTRRWPSNKQPNIFISSSPSKSKDFQGIDLLVKDPNLNVSRNESLPSRCGSAPPSIEGSFQGIHNVLAHKNINISDPVESLEPEEQLRADPDYLSYYHSNVNLNPRLPPPLISRENRHLVRRNIQPSDGTCSSAPFSGASLAIHEEEPEDDRSPVQSALEPRLKSLVDLIQEDFPRTPSPIYTTRPSSANHVLAEEEVELKKICLPQNSSTSNRTTPSRPLGLRGESSSNDARLKSEALVSNILDKTICEVQSDLKNIEIIHQRKSQPPSQHFPPSSSHPRASHGHPKPPPVEVPVLQTSGFSPSHYGPTAYANSGNPFIADTQSSNLFAPQYNFGGYALNASVVPPFMTGYPPHGTMAPTGAGLQQLYKFYGQTLQPSFGDPFYMHYFQQPQFDPSAGTHLDRFNDTKGAAINIPSPRVSGATSPNYFGSPQGLGFMMLYGPSPVGSPVRPESPLAMPRRNDTKVPATSNKSFGSGSGWQGQKSSEKVDDSKPCSFLEDLKSSKARKYDLSDIYGHIVELSTDQHGSRFIQQKLECCSTEEKDTVFEEVIIHASALMTDVFGNYVIQKFFEHGSSEQRRKLANKLVGNILSLSLQMYGCRVIQKALDVLEMDQKIELVQELDGHVMRCVRDQNGNHVIQKCIECVPSERIVFIISAFHNHVSTLSTHPYGCRVIQRVLEHCSNEEQSERIINEILQSVCILAQDQYGNYVTQHVLERGKPMERSQIIKKLAGQIVQMSQNKYASNVIEKCLVFGDDSDKEILIREIVDQSEGNDNLLVMMKDQFANYVVQKILETCTEKQRERLLQQIKVHLPALKKYTYGKHIVARVEQLCGEEASEE